MPIELNRSRSEIAHADAYPSRDRARGQALARIILTVRRTIAPLRRETDAWSLDDLRRTRAGRRGFNGLRWPKACRNTGSVVTEVFMNHTG